MVTGWPWSCPESRNWSGAVRSTVSVADTGASARVMVCASMAALVTITPSIDW